MLPTQHQCRRTEPSRTPRRAGLSRADTPKPHSGGCPHGHRASPGCSGEKLLHSHLPTRPSGSQTRRGHEISLGTVAFTMIPQHTHTRVTHIHAYTPVCTHTHVSHTPHPCHTHPCTHTCVTPTPVCKCACHTNNTPMSYTHIPHLCTYTPVSQPTPVTHTHPCHTQPCHTHTPPLCTHTPVSHTHPCYTHTCVTHTRVTHTHVCHTHTTPMSHTHTPHLCTHTPVSHTTPMSYTHPCHTHPGSPVGITVSSVWQHRSWGAAGGVSRGAWIHWTPPSSPQARQRREASGRCPWRRLSLWGVAAVGQGGRGPQAAPAPRTWRGLRAPLLLVFTQDAPGLLGVPQRALAILLSQPLAELGK